MPCFFTVSSCCFQTLYIMAVNWIVIPNKIESGLILLKPPTRSKYIYSINVDVSLVDDLMHMRKGKPPIKYKTGKPSWINPHKARKWICPTISIYRRYPKSGIGFLLAAVSLIIGSTQQKSCKSLLAHGRTALKPLQNPDQNDQSTNSCRTNCCDLR